MNTSTEITTAFLAPQESLTIDTRLLQSLEDDVPLVRYVQQLMQNAVIKNASDIHFEPFEHSLRIRLRIDGLLCEMAHLPIHLANRIVSRLKVMAQLDIAERRIPQDGRFKLNVTSPNTIDCRLNTCPTIYGEKAVVRLLEGASQSLTIDKLGFTEEQQTLFISAIRKPQGLILVTGPTGSGKTVTLHAALTLRNKCDINISTVEDPVEIHLDGINQININSKTGLHFATVLRALLRQDPDIIMIGEIRDAETAEIAVQAAQTGHLVLSTLHTNNAAETLTRLISMGIPAYNIAASLSLIVAQRLVRCLCQHCKRPIAVPTHLLNYWAAIKAAMPDNSPIFPANISPSIIFTAAGCTQCQHGYKGRISIYELLPITQSMAEIIMTNAHALTIAQQAKSEGMFNLYTAGLVKVFAGITSIQELERVIIE